MATPGPGRPDRSIEIQDWQEGLNCAFRDQGLTVALLATPGAAVPMRDLGLLYHRAAEIARSRCFGLDASKDIEIGQRGLR